MKSPPDNPNRMRRVALRRTIADRRNELAALRGRIDSLHMEIAELEREYAELPWTPEKHLGKTSPRPTTIRERLYRIVEESDIEGITLRDAQALLNPITPETVERTMYRLCKSNLVRREIFRAGTRKEGRYCVVRTTPDPYRVYTDAAGDWRPNEDS